MKTTQYQMQVGLFDKDTKTQKIGTQEAVALMLNKRVEHKIDGLTYAVKNGVYTHNNGEVVIEPCIEITIYAAPVATVRAFAYDLKTILNQEALYLTTQAVQSMAI